MNLQKQNLLVSLYLFVCPHIAGSRLGQVLFRPRYEPYISWIQIRSFNLLQLLELLLLPLLLLPPPPPPPLLLWSACQRTSIVVKHLAVLPRMSLCTVMLSGPTEALRWSLNTVADVKCKFKNGSFSRYPSLFFFITIISASCRLFLLLIKYKLINGLLLLTRHSVERDPLWWTVRVARSIRQPPASPPPPAV